MRGRSTTPNMLNSAFLLPIEHLCSEHLCRILGYAIIHVFILGFSKGSERSFEQIGIRRGAKKEITNAIKVIFRRNIEFLSRKKANVSLIKLMHFRQNRRYNAFGLYFFVGQSRPIRPLQRLCEPIAWLNEFYAIEQCLMMDNNTKFVFKLLYSFVFTVSHIVPMF